MLTIRPAVLSRSAIDVAIRAPAVITSARPGCIPGIARIWSALSRASRSDSSASDARGISAPGIR